MLTYSTVEFLQHKGSNFWSQQVNAGLGNYCKGPKGKRVSGYFKFHYHSVLGFHAKTTNKGANCWSVFCDVDTYAIGNGVRLPNTFYSCS